jgi:hypothetical protein
MWIKNVGLITQCGKRHYALVVGKLAVQHQRGATIDGHQQVRVAAMFRRERLRTVLPQRYAKLFKRHLRFRYGAFARVRQYAAGLHNHIFAERRAQQGGHHRRAARVTATHHHQQRSSFAHAPFSCIDCSRWNGVHCTQVL